MINSIDNIELDKSPFAQISHNRTNSDFWLEMSQQPKEENLSDIFISDDVLMTEHDFGKIIICNFVIHYIARCYLSHLLLYFRKVWQSKILLF